MKLKNNFNFKRTLTQILIGAQILSLPFLINSCSDNQGRKHKTQETSNNQNNTNNSKQYTKPKLTKESFPDLNSKNVDTIQINFNYNPREDPYKEYNKQLDIEVISEKETDLKLSDKIVHVPKGKSTISFSNISMYDEKIIPIGDVRVSPLELDVQYPELMKMRNNCVVIEAKKTLNIYSADNSFFGDIFFESLDDKLVYLMNKDMNKFIFSDDLGKKYVFDIQKEKFNSKARFSNLKLEKIIFNDSDTMYLDDYYVSFNKEERQIIRLNVPNKKAEFVLKWDKSNTQGNLGVIRLDLIKLPFDNFTIEIEDLDKYVFSKKKAFYLPNDGEFEMSLEVNPARYYYQCRGYLFNQDKVVSRINDQSNIIQLYPGVKKVINFTLNKNIIRKELYDSDNTVERMFNFEKTFEEAVKKCFGLGKFRAFYSTGWKGDTVYAGTIKKKQIDYEGKLIEIDFDFPAYQNKFEKIISSARYDDYIDPFLSQKAISITFKENDKEYSKTYYYNEFNNHYESNKGQFYFESKKSTDKRNKEKDTIIGENFAIGYNININIKDFNPNVTMGYYFYDIRNTEAKIVYDIYKISKPKIRFILENENYFKPFLILEDGDSSLIY